MKIKISRHIRKYIIIYIILLLVLYLVIEMVPRVTNIFETTQILEPGSLALTTETEGYLIKTETICVSPESGDITYLAKDGKAVRKNQKVIEIEEQEEETEATPQYKELLDGLKGYKGVVETKRTPVSGIFSLCMDGSEKAMNPVHMNGLTQEKVQQLPMQSKNLRESHISAGDPIYKITNDNKWYVVCWLDKKAAASYVEGQAVKLQLPAGVVDATVYGITEQGKQVRVFFSTDRYYSELASTREVDMTIQASERTGLLIDNECIIEQDGHEGVYVRDKNGEYSFVRVNVIETDGKESVISESSYIDAEGQEVITVSVYDEVLKNPEKQQ